jgi:Protein of unknown function (DUF3631)
VLHSNFGCCIGTIQKSATYKISGALERRTVPIRELVESDAAFGGEKEYAEALRGILNTGHRRGGKSSCCDRSGANFSCRDFSTFCPKAIAGIGKLPDTVADRSIPIRLKRAAPGERIERFRLRDVEAESTNLRDQLEAWCCSVGHILSSARPELPDALTDRQQDGAEPLLAIADAAGGDWPEAARRSLLELCTEAQLLDDSDGKQLLADILNIFESRGDQTPKGYMREDFRDAFLRHLRIVDTCPQDATTQQTNIDEGSSGFSSRNTESAVAAAAGKICNENGACGGVAASRLVEAVCNTGVEEDL